MNQIGLNTEKSKELAESLNDLLANYMVFYQNTRGLHWNIKGRKFFELHLKFEELYTDLQIKIDELAERVLTLGETPMHTFEDYIAQSEIKSARNVSEAEAAVKLILNAFQRILVKQRAILTLSGDVEDEGTNALMSDYIREQEKLVWMYTSFMA